MIVNIELWCIDNEYSNKKRHGVKVSDIVSESMMIYVCGYCVMVLYYELYVRFGEVSVKI